MSLYLERPVHVRRARGRVGAGVRGHGGGGRPAPRVRPPDVHGRRHADHIRLWREGAAS